VDLHQHHCEKILSFIGNATPNGSIALGEDLKRTMEEAAAPAFVLVKQQNS